MESTTIAARKLKNASNSVATALAIAGRALRPCDVCGRERAKWYCKADEAFLCEHCDGSVHGANAVSLRHERVRVGPNGVLMNNVRRTTPDFSPNTTPLVEEDHHTNHHHHHHHHQQQQQRHGSRKKPRSSRSHPSSKIKAEPMSPKLHDLPEEFEILIKQVDEETSHEVPVFVPLVEANEGDDDNGDVDDDDDDDYFPSSLNSIDCSSFLVPTVPCSDNQDATTTEEEEEKEEHEEEEEYEEEEGLCFSRFSVPDECDLDKFLDSDTDLCDMENFIKGGGGEEGGIVDMEEIAELGGVLGLCYDSKDFMDFTDTGAAFSPNEMSMSEEGGSGGGGGEGGGVVEDEFYGTKVKTESDNELDKIKLEVDEMLGFAFSAAASGNFGVKEEEEEEDTKKKISLRLNYEDVLNAWSDRGPFWTEGPRPQTVPDDSSFDLSLASNLDNGLVPDYGIGEPIGQVPVVNFAEDKMNIGGGREARVMRYREKRRTRLFSKKIRYEVRKLNAERRPRLKGRFVKRTLGT